MNIRVLLWVHIKNTLEIGLSLQILIQVKIGQEFSMFSAVFLVASLEQKEWIYYNLTFYHQKSCPPIGGQLFSAFIF